ncbi:MAG: hypothetical protein Q9210_007443 [Variospora velana]
MGRNAITKRIKAGIKHRKRLATSEAIVEKQWNVGLYDILVDNPFAKTISESLAKRLAQLALVLPLHDARAAIKSAIVNRQKTTNSSVGHVCNRDIDSILSRFPRDEKGQPQPSMRQTSAIPTPMPQSYGHKEEEDVEEEDVEEEDIAHGGSDGSRASQERQEELAAPEGQGHAHQEVMNDVAAGSQIIARGPEASKTAGNDREELKRTEIDHTKHQDDRPDSISTSLDWCTSDSVNARHSGEDEALRPIDLNAVGGVTRRKRKAQGDRLYRPTKRRCSPVPPAELARRSGPPLPFITDVEDSFEDSSPSSHIDRGHKESSIHGDEAAAKRRYSSLPPIELAKASGPPLPSSRTWMIPSKTASQPVKETMHLASQTQREASLPPARQTMLAITTKTFPLHLTGIPIEQGHDPTEDISINSPGDAASHMSLQSISLLKRQQQDKIRNEDKHVATDPLPLPRLSANLAALSRGEKINAETLMMILRLLPKGNCELVDLAQVKPQTKRLANPHARQMKHVAESPVTVLVYNDNKAYH